jgi:hypothetical protein
VKVCEYALQVTNGESPAKTINLKDRLPLIKTWVLAKQMMQSPIKNFGLQQNAVSACFFEEISFLMNQHGFLFLIFCFAKPVRPQDKYTKALVAIEILDRNTANPDRANIDAKETPTIKEANNNKRNASAFRLSCLKVVCFYCKGDRNGRRGYTVARSAHRTAIMVSHRHIVE